MEEITEPFGTENPQDVSSVSLDTGFNQIPNLLTATFRLALQRVVPGKDGTIEALLVEDAGNPDDLTKVMVLTGSNIPIVVRMTGAVVAVAKEQPAAPPAAEASGGTEA
jgi:hypothetical protein